MPPEVNLCRKSRRFLCILYPLVAACGGGRESSTPEGGAGDPAVLIDQVASLQAQVEAQSAVIAALSAQITANGEADDVREAELQAQVEAQSAVIATLSAQITANGEADDAREAELRAAIADAITLENALDVLRAEVETVDSELSAQGDSIVELSDAVAAIDAAGLAALLSVAMVNGDGDLVISGANLMVQSGAGSTNGAVNGKGNLVVGYNEGTGTKTGSHNLILGYEHTYTSYGGVVAGYNSSVRAPFASVLGGIYNVASGDYAVVSGGRSNGARDYSSSVCGGWDNEATAPYASVLGGYQNTAGGNSSTAYGGSAQSTVSTYSYVP